MSAFDLEDDEESSLIGGSRARPRRQEEWRGLKMPLAWTEISNDRKCLVLVVILVSYWYFSSSHFNRAGGRDDLFRRTTDGMWGPDILQGKEEVKWAEQIFGVFLKESVPKLQRANIEVNSFMDKLSKGNCSGWAAAFATNGIFTFSLPELHGEFHSRQEVQERFCSDVAKSFLGARLVWHFPDLQRQSALSLFDVFMRNGVGRAQKIRWALFRRLSNERLFTEFKLYAEAPADANLKATVDPLIIANLAKMDGGSCFGFAEALPSGLMTWLIQTSPSESTALQAWSGVEDGDLQQIVAACNEVLAYELDALDFQSASLEGVFPNIQNDEVIVFFHKERRWKGLIDVTDDPEGLFIKMATSTPPIMAPIVRSLYFFPTEGVHLMRQWGWKYGISPEVIGLFR